MCQVILSRLRSLGLAVIHRDQFAVAAIHRQKKHERSAVPAHMALNQNLFPGGKGLDAPARLSGEFCGTAASGVIIRNLALRILRVKIDTHMWIDERELRYGSRDRDKA